MDKKTVKTIVAVILAICLFTMITATVSLAFDAFLSKDVTVVSSVSVTMKKAISYMSNASVALACLLVPALACFAFSYFTKQKKVFYAASAVLSLFIIATCMGFLFDLRSVALNDFGTSEYAVCAEFFENLITLSVASLIPCVYFTVNAVFAFKEKKETVGEVQNEEA